MSLETIVAIVTTAILIVTSGTQVIGWLVKTTRSFTGQLLEILTSINELKESDREVVCSIRQIQQNDKVQADLIDGLIKKHIETTGKIESIEKQLIDLSENMFHVMSKLRMKPRSRV